MGSSKLQPQYLCLQLYYHVTRRSIFPMQDGNITYPFYHQPAGSHKEADTNVCISLSTAEVVLMRALLNHLESFCVAQTRILLSHLFPHYHGGKPTQRQKCLQVLHQITRKNAGESAGCCICQMNWGIFWSAIYKFPAYFTPKKVMLYHRTLIFVLFTFCGIASYLHLRKRYYHVNKKILTVFNILFCKTKK